MHDNKIQSRLKAHLTEFLLGALRWPIEAAGEVRLPNAVRYPGQPNVKLSNIAGSPKEKIPLIETEKRLSRNLKAEELEHELIPQLATMAANGSGPTPCWQALDLSDIRKEYAQKME